VKKPVKRMKRTYSANGGFTLVEVIVSFALLAVLLATALTVLISFSNVYVRVSNLVKARSVASIIAEDIESELSCSSGEVRIYENAEALENKETAESGIVIKCRDKNHNQLIMSAEAYPPEENDAESRAGEYTKLYREIKSGEVTINPETTWYYPSKTYMGMKITSLTFEYKGGNYIKMTLKVSAGGNGTEYVTSRYIECFNLGEMDFNSEENEE